MLATLNRPLAAALAAVLSLATWSMTVTVPAPVVLAAGAATVVQV